MGLAVARLQRRRDQGAVVERRFFIVDDPRRAGARFAFRRPARSARRGCIKAVVAFQSLAIVSDLTARPKGVLGLGAGGKSNAGASDGQYGAHGPHQSRSGLGMQDHINPCTRVLELDQAKGTQELEYGERDDQNAHRNHQCPRRHVLDRPSADRRRQHAAEHEWNEVLKR